MKISYKILAEGWINNKISLCPNVAKLNKTTFTLQIPTRYFKSHNYAEFDSTKIHLKLEKRCKMTIKSVFKKKLLYRNSPWNTSIDSILKSLD